MKIRPELGTTWTRKDGTKTTYVYKLTGGYNPETHEPMVWCYDSQRDLLRDVIAKELYIVDLTINIKEHESGDKTITHIVTII